MKDLGLLVWLTQLGLSVALPLAGFVWLGVFLRERFALGGWVILVAVVVGVVCALDGLRSSVRAMKKMTEDKKDPPLSFNDHD